MPSFSSLTNRSRWVAAAGILAAGSAWAGTLLFSPVKDQGPDTAQLRTLAERLQAQPVLAESPELTAPAPSSRPVPATRVRAATPPRSFSRPIPVLPPAAALPAPAEKPAVTAAAEKPAPAAPKKPESPVKNLALMGITHRGDNVEAWLVNLENQERDVASLDDDAFGLTVKEIGDESVLLARGSEEYLLRLGEKPIPAPAAEASPASASTSDGGSREGGRSGRFGSGRWGGGDGSRDGSSDRSQRFAEFRSRFGGGSRWSGGGASPPAPPSSSPVLGASATPSASTGSGSSGRSRGFRSSGSSSYGSGGFGGGQAFPGQGGAAGSTSQFAAGSTAPTPNPQTARRRGAQLVGESQPLPAPEALTNPQTQRRTGASSGPAFGQSPAGTRAGQAGGRTGTGGMTRPGR